MYSHHNAAHDDERLTARLGPGSRSTRVRGGRIPEARFQPSADSRKDVTTIHKLVGAARPLTLFFPSYAELVLCAVVDVSFLATTFYIRE